MEREPRIGVYVCHCGVNIAATVDVEEAAAFAKGLPGVVVARDYTYMCSDPGQVLIQQDIEEYDLNGVVVASCSPRMHEPTFRAAGQQAGLNPYLVDMANIREQCSWVHKDIGQGTEKAKALIASQVAKVARLQPLEEREVGVTPGALVIGGGVAGMVAALDVAEAGFQVYLVEKEDHLGGRVAELNQTFPAMKPVPELIGPMIERIQEHPNITLFLNSTVTSVDGYVGNFEVKVGRLVDRETGKVVDQETGRSVDREAGRPGDQSTDSQFTDSQFTDSQSTDSQSTDLPISQSIEVGSIVVATGYDVFDPNRTPEYGYAEYPNVITSLEMEERLAEGDLTVEGRTPESIAFIKCVGSRDVLLGNPYCSRVCCMYTAKQSHLVREMLPDADVTVFYIDVRTFDKGAEEFYDETREMGVRYRRSNISEIYRRGDRVVLVAEDTLLGQPIEFEADLVVLAVGMEPRGNVNEVAQLLKLPRSADGFFLEAHPKLRPVDTAMDGVFLAGCCQGPKNIPDTIAQAKAAASSALIPLVRGTVPVESETAVVNDELCAGCGMCVDVCPYDAPALDELWGVSHINPVLCKACGACAVTCPSKAILLQHFTAEQVLAQVDALVGA